MDMLTNGLAWLTRQREAHFSQPVAYIRGATRAADIPATPGRSVADFEATDGAQIRATVDDWIVSADRLAAFGQPMPGDYIEATHAGQVIRYVVSSPAGGSAPCFRFTDASRREYRIHSRPLTAIH